MIIEIIAVILTLFDKDIEIIATILMLYHSNKYIIQYLSIVYDTDITSYSMSITVKAAINMIFIIIL